MLQRHKSVAWCLLGLKHYVQILPCLRKETVNSNVLSLNLKLFRTKVEIKSVIRDYLLGDYVVNVWSFKTWKLSIKGELQRQNKLISSKRLFKILQNETKIIEIGQAVLEIFNFKGWDLENFTRKNDIKTENVVFFQKFCKNWRTIDCVTSEMINAQFNSNQSRIFPSKELIRTWNFMDE